MNFNQENIALIIVIIVFFSIIVFVYGNELNEDIYSMMFTLPIAICAVMAFTLSVKYKKVPKFCLGHIFLGISMTFFVLAEISWIIFSHLNLDQYPSLIDIFYSLYFLFAILHPISVLKFFQSKPQKKHYALVGGIVGLSLLLYVVFTPALEGFETWIVGIHFIAMSSTLLGVAIVATILLNKRQVFPFWIVLAISFFINCLADLHYYSSENWSEWQITDFVNVMWFTSNMVMVYALLQHRRMYHILKS